MDISFTLNDRPTKVDVDPSTLGDLFADPAESAVMREAQESFATEMRSRIK